MNLMFVQEGLGQVTPTLTQGCIRMAVHRRRKDLSLHPTWDLPRRELGLCAPVRLWGVGCPPLPMAAPAE